MTAVRRYWVEVMGLIIAEFRSMGLLMHGDVTNVHKAEVAIMNLLMSAKVALVRF